MVENRIKELRKEKGLSQAELANMPGIGVSQTAVAQWESGKTQPRRGKLAIMEELFGVSADYIMGETDEPGTVVAPCSDSDQDEGQIEFAESTIEQETVAAVIESDLSADEERLLDYFYGTDDTGRKMILAVARLEYERRRKELLKG